MTFPFSRLFSDPGFYEYPDIIAIVEQLAGKDFVMCQLASDTPMYQLALNYPLVDVTMLTKKQGMDLLEKGTAKIEAVSLQMGDVMIRDVRTLHRPEVLITIFRAEHENLSEFAKNMLRNNPVTDELDFSPKAESYTNFLY